MMRSLALVALGLIVGCDASGLEFRPAVSDAPSVLDLGVLPVIPQDEWFSNTFDPTDPTSGVVYAAVGADADPVIIGGATFQFQGTGGNVCVVMDPENIYWNLGLGDADRLYEYEDNYRDDADLDMDVGLSAYYTGSPGIAMGDFEAIYTDPSGVDHALEYNECIQSGYNGDMVHSGRSAVESCDIQTDQRAGIYFTGAINTFLLPIDDSKASFAVGVFEIPSGFGGDCSSLQLGGVNAEAGVNECTFPNETNGGAAWEHSEGEEAFCQGVNKLNQYCEAHLEDENPPCTEPTLATDPT